MSIKQNIKKNIFLRGLYVLWKEYLGIKKRSFGYIGKNVTITPPIYVAKYDNVSLGANSAIGPKSFISAINAKFICKSNVAIAEGLTVHTGNHARIVGKNVTDITEADKPRGYDHDVVVEEDVWIGSHVTLLCGVTIGRGSTVAAGAVVNKSMPPYCICGGVPAKFIKFYWTIDQILEHEQKLYPQEERYTRKQLEEIFLKWNNSL